MLFKKLFSKFRIVPPKMKKRRELWWWEGGGHLPETNVDPILHGFERGF